MRRRTLLGLGLACALAGGLVWVDAQAQAPAVQRTILQRGDLSTAGHEAVMGRADFVPGAETGRHTHPGEEVSYVLEGTILLEVQGKPAVTLKAGDVLFVEAGKIHNAKNTGTGPAKVLATYIVEKGKPLTSPAQ